MSGRCTHTRLLPMISSNARSIVGESTVDTLAKVRLTVCHGAVREKGDVSVVALSASVDEKGVSRADV